MRDLDRSRMYSINSDAEHEYKITQFKPSSPSLPPSYILPLHLEVTSRLPGRMHLLMIVKLLARELALADFVLVLVRGDAVFGDAVAVAVFHGLGDVGGVLGFVAMPWSAGIV